MFSEPFVEVSFCQEGEPLCHPRLHRESSFSFRARLFVYSSGQAADQRHLPPRLVRHCRGPQGAPASGLYPPPLPHTHTYTTTTTSACLSALQNRYERVCLHAPCRPSRLRRRLFLLSSRSRPGRSVVLCLALPSTTKHGSFLAWTHPSDLRASHMATFSLQSIRPSDLRE